MILVVATLRAYPLFTHQIFFPLPDSSVQYSWSLELHFHKSKCRHGFYQIWGRLDVLELNQPLHCQRTTNPRVRRQSWYSILHEHGILVRNTITSLVYHVNEESVKK